MATFPAISPSIGTKKKTTFKILDAAFGDGFSQRAKDGLNSQREVWDVVFAEFPDATIATIEAFLDGQGGDLVFDWTPPKEVTVKKYTCQGYDTTPTGFESSTLTAIFRQEFDL